MKLVIVGGVAGGASAAARARRLSEDAEIVMFERGPNVSFANCGLPYYIGGEIKEREKLLVAKPELLRNRFRLDVRINSNIRKINRAKMTVEVEDLATGRVYEESYDKLILATGAAPLRPPIPGIDLPQVQTLRTLADTDRIKAMVDAGAKRAIVVGAGFIGLEMVENLVRRGVQTTLIELQDQVLPPFDRELTTPVAQILRSQGVDLRLGEAAETFEREETGVRVRLKSGATISADLVILGIGVRPENVLATSAGIEVGPRGGIKVNDRLQTSDPDIYAVGDVVETTDAVTGDPTQVPLAGPANRQGRLAADHALGHEAHYRGTQATAILGAFGLTLAMTGQSEKALVRSKRAFDKIYVHPNQHAGYYPGAKSMTIKLLFSPEDGLILGAEAVGEDGVDNRINALAIAIQGGLTVFDLEEAELAYAPQFGSAKDAINMAGFVASNVLRGEYRQVFAEDLSKLDVFLLDVRSPEEFALGSIPGALNIPVDALRQRLNELPPDRPIVAYCQAGQRGYVATRILAQKGFDVTNLAGGYKTYRLVYPE